MRSKIATVISLIALIALASPLGLFAQSTTTLPSAYGDVASDHPFYQTLKTIKSRGYMKGYEDGTFAPQQSINRAEFLKTVMSAVTTTPKGSECFSDVHNEWFAPYVCEAKTRGIIKGYPDGSFKPGNNINFVEAAQIFAKANALGAGAAQGSDPWYKPAVTVMQNRKAIPVTIDTLSQSVSRQDAAEMLYRIKENVTSKPTKTLTALSEALPTISSCDELQEKMKIFDYRQYGSGFGIKRAMPMMSVGATAPTASQAEDMSVGAEPPAPGIPSSSGISEGKIADTFSKTNVQVEGVDEADIVKNDASYIYILSESKVRIVSAYPPAQMKQVGTITLEDANFSPQDMYVDADRLVLIGTTYENQPDEQPAAGKIMMLRPIGWRDTTRSVLAVINIADRANPKVERMVKIDGSVVSSRKIDGNVYLITDTYNGYHTMLENKGSSSQIMPYLYDSKVGLDRPIANCNQVRFMPDYQDVNFVTVTSLDVNNSSSIIKKEVIMGSGDTVYASRDSLYIAATRYSYPMMGRFDIWAPPTDTEKTQIIRFALNDGAATYSSTGTVPGHILNQFSMDENGTAFRIATTVGEAWFGPENTRASKNSLYVLSRENLAKQTGALENIAPGEKIYSVRFIGNRAYMVTFKKVDPFFVLDVSDATNPRILGQLKIPGYSDYLHPFDENHIIGFGKDAVDPKEIEEENPGPWSIQFAKDFAWYQGMKIALFDVTDVANPKLQFNEVIGDRGTDSELLHNHKALFYDRENGIFAFPVTVAKVSDADKARAVENKMDPGSAYGEQVFQGAYVYKLDLTNGFQLLAKITHMPAGSFNNENTYVYDGMAGVVRRIVSIGNYLYTVSPDLVKAFAIGNTINADAPVGSAKVEMDAQDMRPNIF